MTSSISEYSLKNFNTVSQIKRRAEQCQFPIKIICIKLDSYDLAAGSVCLHAIT